MIIDNIVEAMKHKICNLVLIGGGIVSQTV